MEIIDRLLRRVPAGPQVDLPFDPPLAAPAAEPEAAPAAAPPPPRPRSTRQHVATPEDRAAFAEGVRELEEFLADAGGDRMRLVRASSDAVWVDLAARDDEVYRLRVRAPRYLVAPPDAVFVNARGAADDCAAWPRDSVGTPFRTFSLGLCTPPTAWFHRVHPERRYRSGEGTLVAVVGTIFAALQAAEYRGRHRGPGRRRRGLPAFEEALLDDPF